MNRFFCFLLGIASLHLGAEEIQFYGQFAQDEFLYQNVFKDKKNGIFIDVGAHDGVTLSNSYFFEKYRDWTGICIEPNPDVFDALEANRECYCVQGCIGEEKNAVIFLKVNGYAQMLSGILSEYAPSHLERIRREIRENGGSSEVISVNSYDLTRLLLESGISHVDLLCIDTEGGELGILQSIDFSQIAIDVIVVENNYADPFQAFLQSKGYEKIATLGVDEIYRKVV